VLTPVKLIRIERYIFVDQSIDGGEVLCHYFCSIGVLAGDSDPSVIRRIYRTAYVDGTTSIWGEDGTIT
jgi:hypothetical protein